jgi:glycyl-tRNA synthetase beta chain
MPEFFLELFSEEIPARMQRTAADTLQGLISLFLEKLLPPLPSISTYFGPRRLAASVDVFDAVPAATTSVRGPRLNAPEQALSGFLRRYAATRGDLRADGDHFVLDIVTDAVPAAQLIASEMPKALRDFPWPKSMRWGGTSAFVWVRPLRRIICLLDGVVVPFDLRDGSDDGHGLVSGDLTEGHRFHAPGAFAVTNAANWRQQLLAHKVLVDADDRKRVIADRIAGLAAEKSLAVIDDPGLLEEVAGLVEWPVPHLGRIADEHMDLPPEVMQVSMRVNQRYFALRTADGAGAPWFAFVANIQADDNGAVIVAGNERVLRARFADARHFWDLDRKAHLESLVPALESVTFHAKLGTQGDRVRRLAGLAETVAPLVGANPAQSARAATLAKADLVSGMVGEFPELQGVMGRYYALHHGEPPAVADAIRDHYAPRGPAEAAPSAPVSVAVALGDKLDQLTGFFAIGQKPTGSNDPYGLRRAALGVIRIIRENGLRLRLLDLCENAVVAVHESARIREQAKRGGPLPSVERMVPGSDRKTDPIAFDVVEFLQERLRVQLRSEGLRHDVLDAVLSAHWDDDLLRTLARADAVTVLLQSDDGANLLTAYRRAANILRIEERKDGPFKDSPDPELYREAAEIDLDHALAACHVVVRLLNEEAYGRAMSTMAGLRAPLDAFFEKVTVNATEPILRRNRLRLLNQVRSIMDQIADFSRIEG